MLISTPPPVPSPALSSQREALTPRKLQFKHELRNPPRPLDAVRVQILQNRDDENVRVVIEPISPEIAAFDAAFPSSSQDSDDFESDDDVGDLKTLGGGVKSLTPQRGESSSSSARSSISSSSSFEFRTPERTPERGVRADIEIELALIPRLQVPGGEVDRVELIIVPSSLDGHASVDIGEVAVQVASSSSPEVVPVQEHKVPDSSASHVIDMPSERGLVGSGLSLLESSRRWEPLDIGAGQDVKVAEKKATRLKFEELSTVVIGVPKKGSTVDVNASHVLASVKEFTHTPSRCCRPASTVYVGDRIHQFTKLLQPTDMHLQAFRNGKPGDVVTVNTTKYTHAGVMTILEPSLNTASLNPSAYRVTGSPTVYLSSKRTAALWTSTDLKGTTVSYRPFRARTGVTSTVCDILAVCCCAITVPSAIGLIVYVAIR